MSEKPPPSFASPPCYEAELSPAGGNPAWDAVRSWRVQTRRQLIALRDGMPESARLKCTESIVRNLRDSGLLARHEGIAFYWPMASEIDLRPLMSELSHSGRSIALPVIVEKDRPLEFWRWRPGDALDESGPWDIPAPAKRELVAVSLLLVPMLGFDDRCHRLGHGGGYYDRTLASMNPKPSAIGVAFEACRLRSIYPQSHDVAMDVIVTERLSWFIGTL